MAFFTSGAAGSEDALSTDVVFGTVATGAVESKGVIATELFFFASPAIESDGVFLSTTFFLAADVAGRDDTGG